MKQLYGDPQKWDRLMKQVYGDPERWQRAIQRSLQPFGNVEAWNRTLRQLEPFGDPDRWERLRYQLLGSAERWEALGQQAHPMVDQQRLERLSRQLRPFAQPEYWDRVTRRLLVDPQQWERLGRAARPFGDPSSWRALQRQLAPLRDPNLLQQLLESLQPPAEAPTLEDLRAEAGQLEDAVAAFAEGASNGEGPGDANVDLSILDALPDAAAAQLLLKVMRVLLPMLFLAGTMSGGAIPLNLLQAIAVLMAVAEFLLGRLDGEKP